MSTEQKQFVDEHLKASSPAAVDNLMNDLRMFVAYEAAAKALDTDSMKKAYNSLSWSDVRVQNALPEYLNATGAQRARVDYAYNALFPRPLNEKDPMVSSMTTWMKARLMSYDKVAPFEFSPYN